MSDRAPFAAAAPGAALVVAGGLVAAANSATPFAHGSWLAAYLVLVGGVAQVALCLGAPAPAGLRARMLLWNAGTILVPAGVLSGLLGLVAAGSAALLVALASFASASHRTGRRGASVLAYRGLLAALALSVAVGVALAAR